MNELPKRCIFCGGKLSHDPNFSKPWEGRMICKCGAVAQIVYGDQMGGADFCEVEWKKPPYLKVKKGFL